MRVRKRLNNNAVVAVDERRAEVVVTGKGVGYGLAPGDEIDDSLVEKVFRLSSDSLSQRLQEVLPQLSIEEIRVVEDIVSEVRLNLGKPVSDSLFISLADHIHLALDNLRAGVTVPNGLLLDVIRFYPDEYALGQRAIDLVEERLARRLPDDEAGFVALHIVNAEMGEGRDSTRAARVTKIIEEALATVREFFNIDIKENSIAHFRFINHLRYFAERVVTGSTFAEDNETRELLDVVSAKYPDALRCAQRIADGARDEYGVSVGCDELLYLTIHIQHALQTER